MIKNRFVSSLVVAGLLWATSGLVAQNMQNESTKCDYIGENAVVQDSFWQEGVWDKVRWQFENPNYVATNMLHSLFCAHEFMLECVAQKQDLIISYADIVYFAPCIERLKKAKGELLIYVDLRWQELWQRRFSDILSDAETLKMQEIDGEFFITELGKKPRNLSEIQAQYMGLFKISHTFLPKVIEFYDTLDKGASFDGQPFSNIYMTSFLQGLIDKFHNAKAVKISGGWCEIDFKSDLKVEIVK